MPENRPRRFHFGESEQANFQNGRIFDNFSAPQIQSAEHFRHAEKSFFLNRQIDDRRTAIDAKTTGKSVKLGVESLTV